MLTFVAKLPGVNITNIFVCWQQYCIWFQNCTKLILPWNLISFPRKLLQSTRLLLFSHYLRKIFSLNLPFLQNFIRTNRENDVQYCKNGFRCVERTDANDKWGVQCKCDIFVHEMWYFWVNTSYFKVQNKFSSKVMFW